MNNNKPFILTPDCVMAIGKVVDVKDYAMMLGMDELKFKRLLSGCVEEHIIYDGYCSKFRLPDNSTYAVEFLRKAKAIIKEIGNTTHMELYQAWDEKKRCYKKDFPVMIRSDEMGIVIAPRLERD
jgi:hypothetical protein